MPSTALLLLMIGLFGGIFAELPDPTVKKLTMTKIDLDSDGNKKIRVDFTLEAAADVTDLTIFVLIVGSISKPSIDTEYTMESFIIADNCVGDKTKCHVIFTKPFEKPTESELFFILGGEHPTKKFNVVDGVEYVTIEEFPSDVNGQWVGKKGLAGKHGHTLRINEKVKGLTICIDGELQTDEFDCQTTGGTDKPCYAINIGVNIDASALSICQSTDNNIPVIVKSIAAPTPADTTVKPAGPEPSSIVFDYTTNTITNGVTAGNNEALVFKKGGKDGIICTTVESCVLTGYAVDDQVNELDIVFITTDGSSAITSYEFSFQDSSLQVFALLDTGVLEARWHYHEDKYTATRTIISGGSDDPFTVVESDCTDNNGFCYAYYVRVVTGTYTVTTKPNNGNGDDDKNQIVSLHADVATIKSSRSIHNYTQVIHVESTVTSVTEQNTKFDVCFNSVANSSAQGMHYEFLAINSKGMWKKFLGEKKKSESHACFYALDLITADFNENSKFLVLLRDTTNGNVLNSGEAALHLQALRAIKPEVDNGNNGSTSTLAIVGVAIGGIAFLMALVATAIMFIMKIKRNNDGLQYPLHHTNIEQDSSYIHGLDNPIPTL